MVVGAVAQILEDVAAVGERRLADPVGAFAAHVGVAEGRAVHPLRHEMAAEAGVSPHTLRNDRRGIVRTAGAEIRGAHRDILQFGHRALGLLETRDARRKTLVMATPQQALADRNRDVGQIKRTLDRKQPIALLVAFADADRLVRRAVEFLANLYLDERALLLDHDDEIEAVGELRKLAPGQRPRAADLVDPDAPLVALDLVEVELIERLAHVEVALAGRDDADLGVAAAGGDVTVDLVGVHEGQHRAALDIVQPRLLAEDGVDQPDIETALRHAEIVREHDLHPVEAAVDDRGRLDRLVHALERRPGAAEPRHGQAVEAVIDDLLHARRVQDRDHHVDEVVFGLMRSGRGFGRMVVAHQREHAAVGGGAGEVRMPEHVTGAVDARALAVPDAEHAIELALAPKLRLLGAPQRGGGEILVDTGLEHDVAALEERFGAPELLVEPTKRRAAVSADVAGRVEPGAAVALLLHQAQ